MKNNTNNSTTVSSRWMRFFGIPLCAGLMLALMVHTAIAAGPVIVNLGTAADFRVLAKTGISSTGVTSITGDIGISPGLSSAISGNFALSLDGATGQFSTSPLVSGKVYAADYAVPTPAKCSIAVANMMAAYTDANSRAVDVTDAGSGGDLAGLTLTPGVYFFSGAGNVTISNDLHLSGGANDVWIFQIAGTLDISANKKILLSGGAQAANIFWAVAGTTTLEAGSIFEGNILGGPGASTIAGQNGAILHGRALTQTAVTLIANTLTLPAGPGGSVAVDTLGARAKQIVKLQNKTVQDSVVTPTFSILVGDTLTSSSDSVAISFNAAKFLFAQAGPYRVAVNGTVVADSARVNTAGTSLFIKITGPVSGTYDTLTVAGVFIKGDATQAAASDSSTTDNLKFAVGDGAGATAGLHLGTALVLMPGTIWNAAITGQPGTTNVAGVAISANPILTLTDKFGNTPAAPDTVATIAVAPVLSNGTSPGNGTISGASTITRTFVAGAPGSLTYTFTGLKYTKAETIRLKFTPPSGTAVTSQVAGIAVAPGAAANISAALHPGSSDTITVDQTIQYDVTVTDQFFNPVGNGPGVIGVSESTSHGGTVDTPAGYWTLNGAAIIKFSPSKFFVGPDTLTFVSPASGSPTATSKRAITIGAGSLGGIIVDYAGTASGAPAGGGAISSPEAIAAGTTIYARTFLRDTYGNPIDATSTSTATFTISGKNGKNTLLGTAALTSAITESQYPNTNKTAVGVAIPYTVSSNLRASSPDSVLATVGTYSATVLIQNRSNVPNLVKIVQSVAGDSSLVASNYTNQTTYSDTVWDVYGNLVSQPGTVKIAPLKAAYAMYVTTMGKAGFVRTNDTTFADTLYPAAGIINRTVWSSKVAGLDTIKTWSAGGTSNVAAAPFWVTPNTFAKIAITPHVDTTAIAGKIETFTLEKQDTYGNHIDFGLSGAQTRGNSPVANWTKPTGVQILADSTSTLADTVSTGHNRGGKIAKSATSGTVGVASVGGTKNLTLKFTPYTVTADTQKFYAALGGFVDTVQVRSIPTGVLASFTVAIATADSSKNAGDSVKVTITAFDALANQIYSYNAGGQSFTVNNTSVAPIATKDTTFYFSYVNVSNGAYVKSTGAAIPDTVFTGGVATLYLHKFTAEALANTVTVTAGTVTGTSAKGSKFKPLTSVGQTTWTVTIKDTVNVNTLFNVTITPRDMYGNVNTASTNFATVTSNQGVNFDGGVNPKIFSGPVTFTASQLVATNSLIVIVSNGSSIINGQSNSIVVVPAVVNATVSGTVVYASAGANAIGAVAVTLTPATGSALTATSSATGTYSIANVPAGTYTLTAAKTGGWGGANATDALLIAKHSAGTQLLTGLPLAAGDVTNSNGVNNTDALQVVLRNVGTLTSFAAGDWTFQSQSVTVTSSNVTANISGLAVGDVNASYVPASGTVFAKAPATSISGSEFVVSGPAQAVAAVTMKINVNGAKVASISSKLDGVSKIENGAVSFAWFAKDGKAVNFNTNEAIVKVTLVDKAVNGNVTIESELADAAGKLLESNLAVTKELPTTFELSQNYPNPFNPSTQINYSLPQSGLVTLSVYNLLGQEVAKLVNEQKEAGNYTVQWAPRNLASGVYIYRIHVQTEKESVTSVKRLTLLK